MVGGKKAMAGYMWMTVVVATGKVVEQGEDDQSEKDEKSTALTKLRHFPVTRSREEIVESG
jgi:hypothetical protein